MGADILGILFGINTKFHCMYCMISCPKKQMFKYRIANILKEATALLNSTNYEKTNSDVPPSICFLKGYPATGMWNR